MFGQTGGFFPLSGGGAINGQHPTGPPAPPSVPQPFINGGQAGFSVPQPFINGGQAGSFVPQPPAAAFNAHHPRQRDGAQAVHSSFTPDCHQFPYLFSRSTATPPMYSWANSNSTDVMKFTGSRNPQPLDTSAYRHSNFGPVPKRKMDFDDALSQPPKMRITEEKVSASLRDMHISSEFKPHSYSLESNESIMDIPENENLINTINGYKTSPESQNTIIMCEELRKLNKIDSIIPKPLLSLDRPTNAVVVWKPQPYLDLVNAFSAYYEEPKSTVVITEITDEEENAFISQNEMLVEENNCISSAEDDEMEL